MAAVTGNYRISPIYSVQDECFEPTSETPYYVGLFFCEHGYTELGRLVTQLPYETHKFFWFSHGLASIVVISTDLEIYDKVRHEINTRIRGYELWHIKEAGEVVIRCTSLSEPAPYDAAAFQLNDFTGLESDMQWVLQEYQHSIAAACSRAAQYAPSQLVIFDRLTKAINSIVEQLIFLKGCPGVSPSHPTRITDSLIGDEVKRKKHFDFLASQLVQVNSALSYIVSQGYSGIIPVFENECHIRSFSLLGVGTSYRALSAYARHVEKIFENHAIAEVIHGSFGNAVAPDPGKYPGTHKSMDWDRKLFGIDNHLRGAKTKVEDNPKLVYYSGRQGFRETKFTISAPINTLNAAASIRWSLMTLSHELMHAHVMSIIAALFGEVSDQKNEEFFFEIVKRFDDYRYDRRKTPMNLKDCLCFIILNYCCFIEGIHNRHITGGKIRPSGSKNKENIKEVFAAHFGEVNEIVVHVLDYIYFYNQDDAAYIGLLWESWSPVPVVLEKIEGYILRTILAIGTKETGDPSSRFFTSLKIFKRELLLLHARSPENIVIRHALDVVERNDSTDSELLLMFSAGIYLADMAAKLLASSHVHGNLLNDRQRVPNEDETAYYYTLDVGQFEPMNVESPVALSDWLLRKALSQENDLDCDTASAWAFLACASYLF
jgi:hypothetical protein